MFDIFKNSFGANPEGEVTPEEIKAASEQAQARLRVVKPEGETLEQRRLREEAELAEVSDPRGKEASPLSRVLAGSTEPADIENLRKMMTQQERVAFDKKLTGDDDESSGFAQAA